MSTGLNRYYKKMTTPSKEKRPRETDEDLIILHDKRRLKQEDLLCGEIGNMVGEDLVQRVSSIVKHWNTMEHEGVKKLLRNKGFTDEIEEAVTVAHHLLNEIKNHPDVYSEPRPLFDICCGKGFTSALIQSLCSEMDILKNKISTIFMFDYEIKGDIDFAYLTNLNDEYAGDGVPELKFINGNIHDKGVLRDLGLDHSKRGILVGVHLCKRLSARFVELFLFSKGIDSMILSPCCLPHGGPIKLADKTLQPKTLKGRPDAYNEWASFLQSCCPTSSLHVVPLRGSQHRKNIFITSSRAGIPERVIPPPIASPNEKTCTQYYYTSTCKFKKVCKYEHVEGKWC